MGYNINTQTNLFCFPQIRNTNIQIPILTNRIISFELPVIPSFIIGLNTIILTNRWKQVQAIIDFVFIATCPIPQLPKIRIPRDNKFENDWRKIEYIALSHEMLKQIKVGTQDFLKKAFDNSYFMVQILAFIFGIISITLTIFLSNNTKKKERLSLVLAGISV